MDYGTLLRKAWDIIWKHKWLILLGVLVALGSGNTPPSSGGSDTGYQIEQEEYEGFNPSQGDFDPFRSLQEEFQRPEFEEAAPFLAVGAGIGVALMCLVAAVFVVLWAVSTIARGGLVAGVNAIEARGASSFAEAWRAGWARGWRLLGISLLPALPILVMVITNAGLLGGFVNMTKTLDEQAMLPAGIGLGATAFAILCVAGVTSLILGLLRTFAERACMLEDKGVFDSYSRGWQILRENVGEVLILFLIQIAINIALFLVLLGPGIIVALCACVLWPVALLFSGVVEAYFSTMWTLGWRHWTGLSRSSADVAPAV